MEPFVNLNDRLKTAVSLIILLLFTACTVTEARPTSIPTVVTSTPEVTAVPTTPAEATETVLPTPTTPRTEPTAVPTREIRPTLTPTPQYPMLPSENSLSFTLQNQFGGSPQAMLVDGTIAYLAVGPRLVAVDVTDSSNPQFLSQSPILDDVLFDIAQEGSFIYGAAGRAGLVVLNVSDPANIQLVNDGPNYSGANAPNTFKVESSNGRIFIDNVGNLSNKRDLIWFDLSVPDQPAFAGTMPLNNSDFNTTNELLLIITEAGIQVMNPQNPAQELSRINAEQGIYQMKTAVYGNLLYFTQTTQNTLSIYDLTDPTNPQMVPQDEPFSLSFLGEFTGNTNTLVTSSTRGEFGYCFTILEFVDISKPETPQKTAEFDPQNCSSTLVGSGEFLYIAGLSGLQIYSTSDPSNIQLLGHYVNPTGVQSADDFLPGQPASYLISNDGRGAIITSVELRQDTLTTLDQTESPPGYPLLQLLSTEKTLIAYGWNNGLLTFDITDPGQLTSLYVPPEESEALGSLHSTALVDKVMYIPLQTQFSFNGFLGVYDLQDPTSPQLVSTVNTGLKTFDTMVAGDGYLYLLEGYEQLTLAIINISQPLEPKLVSSIALPEDATHLAVVGSMLYAMCDGSRCHSLTMVDVADAERPYIINQWQMPFGVVDSVTVGQRLYTISSDNTVRALDVSQPNQPKVIGSIALPGGNGRLTAVENTLYVSASPAGLFILTAAP